MIWFMSFDWHKFYFLVDEKKLKRKITRDLTTSSAACWERDVNRTKNECTWQREAKRQKVCWDHNGTSELKHRLVRAARVAIKLIKRAVTTRLNAEWSNQPMWFIHMMIWGRHVELVAIMIEVGKGIWILNTVDWGLYRIAGLRMMEMLT